MKAPWRIAVPAAQPWQPSTGIRGAESPGPGQGGKASGALPAAGSDSPARGHWKGRDESVHEGHSCVVWVEQHSNFFSRRLYSLQKSFLFISSYGAQQLAAPQLLRTWGCYTWEGDTHRSSSCARHGQQHNMQPGSASQDQCDTEGSGLDHPASPLSHKPLPSAPMPPQS